MLIEITGKDVLSIIAIICIIAGLATGICISEQRDSCIVFQSSYYYMNCLEQTNLLYSICFLLVLGRITLATTRIYFF